jgi:TPR repeat protein
MALIVPVIGKLWLTLMLIVSTAPGPVKTEFGRALKAARAGDFVVAAAIWRAQAQKGLPAAQFNLGVLHVRGRGVARNRVQAAAWFRKAAQAGFAPAAYNLGVRRLTDKAGRDYAARGLKWLRIAADRRFAPAQFLLGRLYLRGKHVRPDKARGVKLIRAAAAQNYPPALFESALILGRGSAASGARARSIKLLRRAARAGLPEAMYYLGIMYERGRHVLQNFLQAHMWYNLAAARGFKKAARRRDELLKQRKMTPQLVVTAQQMAMKWKPTIVYRPTFDLKPMAQPRVKKTVKPVKAPKPAATPRAAVVAMFKGMAKGDLPAIRAVVAGKLARVFAKVSADELKKIKPAGRRFVKIDRVRVQGGRALVTVVVQPPIPKAKRQEYFQKTSATVIRRLRAETDPTRRLLLERRLHYLAQDLDLMGFSVIKQGRTWRVGRVAFGGK